MSVRTEGSRRPLLSREFLDAYRRDALIDGAASASGELGFRQATVADIVRHGRTSRNTFYQHFSSKEAVFLALLERASATSLERTRAACLQAGPEFSACLEAGLGALLGWVAEAPADADALLIEAPALGPAGQEMQSAAAEGFAALLGDALAPGEARAPLTAELLVGGIAVCLRTLVLADQASLAPSRLPDFLGLIEASWERGRGRAAAGAAP